LRRDYPFRPLVGVGAAIIRNSSVLLVRRKEEPAKGLWSIPGGLVGLGETADEAARREAKEETGIDIQIEKLLDVVDNIVRDDQGKIRFHYVLAIFLARPLTAQVKPNSDVSDARWVRFSELPSYEMTKTAKKLLLRTSAIAE